MKRLVFVILIAALVLGRCGGDDDESKKAEPSKGPRKERSAIEDAVACAEGGPPTVSRGTPCPEGEATEVQAKRKEWLSQRAASSAVLDADNYGDGVWGVGEFNEVLIVKVPKSPIAPDGARIQSRLPGGEWTTGTPCDPHEILEPVADCFRRAEQGSGVNRFKLWRDGAATEPEA